MTKRTQGIIYVGAYSSKQISNQRVSLQEVDHAKVCNPSPNERIKKRSQV